MPKAGDPARACSHQHPLAQARPPCHRRAHSAKPGDAAGLEPVAPGRVDDVVLPAAAVRVRGVPAVTQTCALACSAACCMVQGLRIVAAAVSARRYLTWPAPF